ncbi:hypothetical protein IJF86_00280 [Candidatus Saccharibacteria bacterium]|nr:hypothetical protein [Candidatus Saccharibacteria bacterium]
MSIYASFGIIFFAALIHAFFQLDLGGLLLLYHASLKSHVTKKTRVLVSNFILGAAFMLFLGLLASAFLVQTLFKGSLPFEVLSLIVGILVVIAILIWAIYYRSGRSTELWLPRAVSRYINSRARSTSSRIEAFSLGMLTSFSEFPFSFILVFLSANSLLEFSPVFQLISIFGYLFIALLPLLICRLFIKKGKTVVDIQKWRQKNKPFLRFLSGCSFLVLAVFLFVFKILGGLL